MAPAAAENKGNSLSLLILTAPKPNRLALGQIFLPHLKFPKILFLSPEEMFGLSHLFSNFVLCLFLQNAFPNFLVFLARHTPLLIQGKNVKLLRVLH